MSSEAAPARLQEREAVRTTIVGGRPPGSGTSVGSVPRGIEVLVKKAAVDGAFRDALLRERAGAAGRIGLNLAPAERAMLSAVPEPQLSGIIAATRVPASAVPALMGYAAAAMLAALGFIQSVSAEQAAVLGAQPDQPRNDRNTTTTQPTDMPSIVVGIMPQPLPNAPGPDTLVSRGARPARPTTQPSATQPAAPPTTQLALPPAQLEARVQQLVSKLGDNDYATREQATKDLIALGKGVLPLLDKVKSTDPEVVSRIAMIRDRLNPKPSEPPPGRPGGMAGVRVQ